MKDAVSALLGSRKFLLLILDTFVSILLYFGGKYLSPNSLEDMKFLIAALQPVFVTLIYSIAKEDAAANAALAAAPRPTQETTYTFTPPTGMSSDEIARKMGMVIERQP